MGMWDSSKERIDYFKRCRELNAELKAEREENIELQHLCDDDLKCQELICLRKENAEMREMLNPFAMHAKALTKNINGVKWFRDSDQCHDVYEHGVSGLTRGLFNRVLDWFEKESSEDGTH